MGTLGLTLRDTAFPRKAEENVLEIDRFLAQREAHQDRGLGVIRVQDNLMFLCQKLISQSASHFIQHKMSK